MLCIYPGVSIYNIRCHILSRIFSGGEASVLDIYAYYSQLALKGY